MSMSNEEARQKLAHQERTLPGPYLFLGFGKLDEQPVMGNAESLNAPAHETLEAVYRVYSAARRPRDASPFGSAASFTRRRSAPKSSWRLTASYATRPLPRPPRRRHAKARPSVQFPPGEFAFRAFVFRFGRASTISSITRPLTVISRIRAVRRSKLRLFSTPAHPRSHRQLEAVRLEQARLPS